MIFLSTNVICGIIILYMFYLIMDNFGKLPDRVPVRFDISGKPIGYFGKFIVFVFPVVNIGLMIMFNVMSNADTANREMINFSPLLGIIYNFMILSIIWILGFFLQRILESVKSDFDNLGKISRLPIMLLLINISLFIVYMFLANK